MYLASNMRLLPEPVVFRYRCYKHVAPLERKLFYFFPRPGETSHLT